MKKQIGLKISDKIFDINLVFYNFLKKITQAKLTDNQIVAILALCISNRKTDLESLQDILLNHVEEKIVRGDISIIADLIGSLEKETINLFIFSLRLNIIKGLLLEEAKITQTQKLEQLKNFHQLSMAYDKISIQSAYATRISGALLSLLFFEKVESNKLNFFASSSKEFISSIANECQSLMKKGLEPNQIFMLLFSESINQSITSSAGVSYEDRIKNVLIAMGISRDSIKKVHDAADSSTEFDFFFELEGRSYGIGAKRTLRERYKQFIKTASMSEIDVMIEITLGTDLRPVIAESIRKHGVYIFVADEVYGAKPFLQKIEGVYPVSKLNLALLKSLP